MMIKTFGFGVAASSAVLVALLASGGCSSSAETPITATDAGDSGKVVKPDGGDSGTPAESCPGAAPTKADLDSSGGWKPPPAKQTVCTAGDIAAFDANFANANTYADLVKGLPAACSACILTKETDATWGFLVTDDKGELGFVNYGSCYARATGGSDACGKGIQYSEFCISASCSDCSDSEVDTCESDTATQTACSANFDADISAGCGTDQAKLQALDDACGTAAKAAAVLCGGGGTVGDSGGGG
jgi:hypothetical protein